MDPHHFQYGGNVSEITPGQCYRLLQAMWGKTSAETTYLAESVLGVSEESVRTYVNRLNNDLQGTGYPYRLGRSNRGQSVLWTEKA
jgi:hypothetical protein